MVFWYQTAVFVAVLFGATSAFAQARAPENTSQACQDGYDNDGDGFVDCTDQDCSLFVFCSAPQGQPPHPGPALTRDWAFGGALTGLIALPLTLGLGLASEITAQNTRELVPPIPLGGAATLVAMVAGPIAAAGGQSAARGAGVRGCMGCFIAGWVTYGLTMLDASTLIALGATGFVIPAGLISSVTLLGCTSLALFATHAMVAHRQARRRRAVQTVTTSRPLAVAPFVAPTSLRDGAVAGITAIF